jgi:hypothetical protein
MLRQVRGMRLARDQQHAQILAHALDRQHRAVIDRGELALGRLGLDLDDVGAGMVDIDRNFDLLAELHALHDRRLALMRHGQLDRTTGAGTRRVGDLDLDVLTGADDAEPRRAQDLEPTVELAGLAGEQRMYRRIEAEVCGGSRQVMHLAVGDHDHPGKPVWRHVGKSLREIGEQHGAVPLAIGRGRG